MNLLHARRSLSCIACAWLVLCGVGMCSVYAQQDSMAESEAAYRYDPAGKRDPFLSPFYVPPEEPIAEEAKTPLQRFDLGQLKLVGVIWQADEPKALIEDGGGLGYIVTRGTLIGSKGGIIRTIEPKRIVVEEYETDFSGTRRAQERELLLSIIDADREGTRTQRK